MHCVCGCLYQRHLNTSCLVRSLVTQPCRSPDTPTAWLLPLLTLSQQVEATRVGHRDAPSLALPLKRTSAHHIVVTAVDGEKDCTKNHDHDKEGWPHYLNQQAQFSKQMCLNPHSDMDKLSLWQMQTLPQNVTRPTSRLASISKSTGNSPVSDIRACVYGIMRKQPRYKVMRFLPGSDRVTLQSVLQRSKLQLQHSGRLRLHS